MIFDRTRIVKGKKYKQQVEVKDNKMYNYIKRFGRSSCLILCPFCNQEIIAFIWSLAGSGKKCTCGVLHTTGQSFKLLKSELIK